MCEQSRKWIRLGDANRLIGVVSSLSHDFVLENAELSIHYLTALVFEQRFQEADTFASKLRDRLSDPALQNNESSLYLQTNLSSFDVFLETLRGDLSLVSADNICQLKQRLDVSNEFQCILNNIFAYLLCMNGKYDKALFYADRARECAIAKNDWFSQSIATLLHCISARAQGRFDAAYSAVLKALKDFKSIEGTPAWAVLALTRAMLEYEINNLDEAETLLLKAKPYLSLPAISDFRVNTYVTLARIYSSRGNFTAAELLLNELRAVVSKSNDRRWMDYIGHEQIRVAMLAGKQGLYAKWRALPQNCVSESGDALRSKYCPAVGHVPARTQLMLALQEMDYIAAEKAIGHLSQICLLQADLFLRVIVLSGSAVLSYARQNYDEAIVFLNQALHLCDETRLYRVLFDEIFGFSELFLISLHQHRIDEDIDHRMLQRLASEHFPKPRQIPCKVVSLLSASVNFEEATLDRLTDTELKVLELLSLGLSNKEISKRSGIAVTTTKWHLKNIFGKLSTTNRMGAVLRAQELQLLSLAGCIPKTIEI